MKSSVQLDRLALARRDHHDRGWRLVDGGVQGTDRGCSRFANLSTAAAEQPLWRVVDQLGLPLVKLLDSDILGD
jgi:hypothetical protein